MVQMATATISRGNDGPRLGDLFDMIEFDKNLKTIRPVGEIKVQRTHWIRIVSKDGKKNGIPITCIAYDLEGALKPDVKCAFCLVNHTSRATYYCNAIDEKAMRNQPRRLPALTRREQRTGIKEKGSNAWTPVGVWSFPPGAAETIQTLTKSNKNAQGEAKELTDPKFGRALDVSKNVDASSPSNIWSVQRAESKWAALTAEQAGYLTYNLLDLDKLAGSEKATEKRLRDIIKVMDPKEKEFADLDLSAYRAELKLNKLYMASAGADADDGDDEDEAPRKGKSGSFSIRGSASRDDDDDDDDAIPTRRRATYTDDDDDDAIPARRHRPVEGRSKRPQENAPERRPQRPVEGRSKRPQEQAPERRPQRPVEGRSKRPQEQAPERRPQRPVEGRASRPPERVEGRKRRPVEDERPARRDAPTRSGNNRPRRPV